MHHNYMIAISTLFLLVFAIMIHSLLRHRRLSGQAATRFAGPNGSAQWIWATIPLLILAMVNLALFSAEPRHEISPKEVAGQSTVTRLPAAKATAVTVATVATIMSNENTRHLGTTRSLNVALVSSPPVWQ